MTTTRIPYEESSPSFRCTDLFEMNSLQGLKLLAGRNHLDNIISRVNIMEVPDIQNWAQANEFLVTTGYSYQNNMDAFLELIPHLVNRGVAAFGIKPKRFIAEIPQKIIDCAEDHGLPLFELSESTIFSNVVREVMEKIITFETRNILLLQRRLEQVSELMLHGYDMPKILEVIEEMIGNPISILNAFSQFIASTEQKKYFKSFYNHLLSFDSRSSPKHSTIQVEDAAGRCVNLHVFNLWETERDPILVLLAEKNGACSELDLSTVSRMLPLLNIRLSSENTYKLVQAKYFDDFLKDWLMGCIPSSEDLDIKGQFYGYSNLSAYSYRVIIVKFHSSVQPTPDSAMLSKLNHMNPESPALFTAMSGKIIVLMPQPVDGGNIPPDETEAIVRLIAEACDTTDFSLCIGESSAPLSINAGYIDTENLYIASCISRENAKLITWKQLGIYTILTLLPKHANVDKFIDRFIRPLVHYDKAHNSSLIPTLTAYFQMGCNIKLTALAMYTHYNTIVYRLDKIKTILGISFDDAEARLQLQLGLKIYEMGE
ncbi:PucR family transcriptional regulator [Paenibacillus kribbensis]|uniref:PucR family transcriptional regulator n=1 Tax=Paenibacillus kribbensis TaxID=172713 RepID=UPI000837B64A|nr:PucR family transcriptional regulator [Paenibacillus kribbensis]